jgi:magnesium-transporting ATPase (P-type)
MSIMEATGGTATHGISFRDAATATENLHKVDTLIIDKTGTLTVRPPTFERVGLSDVSVPASHVDRPAHPGQLQNRASPSKWTSVISQKPKWAAARRLQPINS